MQHGEGIGGFGNEDPSGGRGKRERERERERDLDQSQGRGGRKVSDVGRRMEEGARPGGSGLCINSGGY